MTYRHTVMFVIMMITPHGPPRFIRTSKAGTYQSLFHTWEWCLSICDADQFTSPLSADFFISESSLSDYGFCHIITSIEDAEIFQVMQA